VKATIWHNPQCSTSRKVLDLMRARGVAPAIVDYLKTPPDAARITAVLDAAGIAARDLLRTKAPIYSELGLADPKWTDAEIVAAMVKHPVLIERPVVITAKGTRLCRPIERVEEIL
jgi:arsenate reductase